MLIDKGFIWQPDDLLVFVHIPKTGGMTLNYVAVDTFGRERVLHPYYQEDMDRYARLKQDPRKLRQYRALLGHFPYGEHKYFKRRGVYFTLVRDPLERFLSLYAWVKQHPEHWLHPAAGDGEDIAAFWRRYREQYPYAKLGEQCYYVCGDGEFRRARDFIDNRYLLAAPLGELDRFIRMLADLFDLKLDKYGVYNSSSGKPAPDSLDGGLVQELRQVYSDDFKLFDYVSEQFRSVSERYPSLRMRARGAVRRSLRAACGRPAPA